MDNAADNTEVETDADEGVPSVTVTHWRDVGGKRKRERTYGWTDFVADARDMPRVRDKKRSRLIKLATFGDVPTSKGSLRHDANVTRVHGVEGDYDAGEITPEHARRRLEQHGVRAVVVTTFSHKPDKPKWRVFAPCIEDHAPGERRRLVARLNGALGGILAPESFNLSLSYFVGAHPDGEYIVLPTFDDPDVGSCIDELDALDEIAVDNGASKPEALAVGRDAVVEALEAQGYGPVPKRGEPGVWLHDCPFEDEHTTPANGSDTAYFEAHTGRRTQAGWSCMHGHCAHRTVHDLREALGFDVDTTTDGVVDRLASTIHQKLCTHLGVDSTTDAKDCPAVRIRRDAIRRIVNSTFFSGQKSKVFILNESHGVNQYREESAWRFVVMACGSVVDRDAIRRHVEANMPDGAKQKAIDDAVGAAAGIAVGEIMDTIRWRNQRDHVRWRVDMFADEPRLDLTEDAAVITLPHARFPDHGEPDADIMADYREHYPEYDDVLRMIAAARFAGDRKRAYLWLLAPSDWGKGFHVACLRELGLVVEMSVKEIERVFEGLPAGKRPEEFKRAWVLAVNEFKHVKSEVKQLESRMQIAPKNQLTSEVELYAKMFLSAENVASLVTDHGVEDQFAQRFSLIRKSGSINDRDAFERDTGAYRRAVVADMARQFNTLVDQYVALGREEADRQATAVLDEFHGRHGLANFAQRITDTIDEVAAEWVEFVLAHRLDVSGNVVRGKDPDHEGNVYVRNPAKEIEDFLWARKPAEQVQILRRRKGDIFDAASVDDRGNASHRDDKAEFKAVRVR